jgi:hypothetical protein
MKIRGARAGFKCLRENRKLFVVGAAKASRRDAARIAQDGVRRGGLASWETRAK